MGERRWEWVAIVGALALLAALVAATGNAYLLSVLNFVGLFAVALLGIVIVLGYAGQIVLGHAAFMGVGAYTSAILTLHYGWPAPLGVAAAGVVVAAVAWLAGKPILRLKGFYLALATLSLAVVIDSILVGWSEMTEGPSGMTGIKAFGIGDWRVSGEWPNFALIYLVLLAALWVTLGVHRSMAGVALRVLHRDEELAASLGIRVSALKTAAFVLSAVFAGVAGAFYAHYAKFISPEIFGLGASFDMLLVAMLGGVWSPFGAIIGAAILKFLPELLGVLQDFRLMAYGLVFILITFFLPDGVMGWVRGLGAARRRAQARELASRAFAWTAAGAPAALSVQGVSRAFQGLQAVDNVTFEVPPGRITALIGPNGAGKSTTVNLISGLLAPDQGAVRLDGADLVGRSSDDIVRAGVARTFQNVRLLGELTVLENVMGGYCARTAYGLWKTVVRPGRVRAEYERARTEALSLMQMLGLAQYADQPARELPFGLQRLAEIARALLMHPRLLLVDEPAAGLNDAETEALGRLLRQLAASGLTILLIEHNMALVQAVAERIVVLHHGQLLADGEPAAVLRDPVVVDAYLGQVSVHVAG